MTNTYATALIGNRFPVSAAQPGRVAGDVARTCTNTTNPVDDALDRRQQRFLTDSPCG